MKSQSFRLVEAILVVGSRLMITPSEGALFSLLSTQEATIADIRAALDARQVTCRQLIQMYLDRIAAYDKKGPALNAIIMISPNVLSAADALDAKFARSGFAGPLHCVPLIIKDNFNTADMPTTARSLWLKGSIPASDGFQVRKLREAGALVLAKSNMAEFVDMPSAVSPSNAVADCGSPPSVRRKGTAEPPSPTAQALLTHTKQRGG
jgi:Asp-tRNA(Asn)/Glu-tRNA(Gln) amidotransferase A subunit family amidase